MTRAERLGIGGATAGHAALIAILSLGLFAAPKPDIPTSQPVDVELVDEVGVTDTAPVVSQAPPAASRAPEIGPSDPVTPPPLPQQSPRIAKAAPLPAPAKPAPPPKGGRLGEDFRKSLIDTAQPGEATAPRVQVGPAQVASLANAIRRQVQPCADRIVSPGPGAEAIVTKLNLRLNQDGSFAADPRVVSQMTGDENARYAIRVGELARAAFRQCAPFELPPELYAGWRNINLNYRLPS